MKWEYTVVEFYGYETTSLAEKLNSLGKQSWELVGIVTPTEAHDKHKAILKRFVETR